MEIISPVVAALSVALLFLALPVYGQPGLPCTPAMLNSFTPCMNFLSNSTANVTTPTPDCCNTLKSLTTNTSGCLCLLIAGRPPFPVPIAINRTLAISLPQACNMPGVPVQCKASTTAPVPAPGPASVALSPPTPDSDTTQGVPGPASSTTTPTGSGGATAPSSSAISSTSLSSLVAHGLGMLFIIYS